MNRTIRFKGMPNATRLALKKVNSVFDVKLSKFNSDGITSRDEFDEQMVRRLIEKISFFSDHLEFTFKSGMTIKLKR